jgi:uncharacterized protein (TIGR02453 family)
MTTPAPAFGGFPKRGVEFLRDLERNNERDWFGARKAIYVEDVEQPLHALLAEVARRCARAKLPLAPNPRQPSFRIYRDVRFSADKSPYKTHAGAVLYRGGDKSAPGGVYIHIEPRESFVAVGYFRPEKETLDALRRAMVADPKAFFKMTAALRKGGASLGFGDSLLRLPRAYSESAGTGLEPYLKLRSLMTQRELDATRLRTAIACDDVMTFIKDAAPLLKWGWQQHS